MEKEDMKDRFQFRVKNIFGEWEYFQFPSCLYEHDYLKEENYDWKTLGQCTGLHDKNGKLIFEGDILEFGTYEKVKGEVVQIKAGWEMKCLGTYWKSKFDDLEYFLEQNPEIIGNIYENPELSPNYAAQ